MDRSTTFRRLCALVAGAVLASQIPVLAQGTTESLGTVRISRQVLANGQALAAGTYTLRLTAETPTPVAGQTPAESRWVEFVQGGQVKGREMATVVTGPEARAVLNGPGPASGTARTDVLRGNDYFRIWINKSGTHYLVHLAIPSRPGLQDLSGNN
jgi:hypothetical protein